MSRPEQPGQSPFAGTEQSPASTAAGSVAESGVLPKTESLSQDAAVAPEGVTMTTSPVNSHDVHGRGELVIPVKGDVFVNPMTGAQQVIERVRKTDGETVVMFTKEIEPGVRTEPGRPMRQLPVKNYEVQRGEYTEYYSAEYDTIFNDCAEALDAMNRAYASQDGQASSVAQDTMDRVGELAQEIGEIDDIWEELGNKIDRDTILAKHKLIGRLKGVVAELPEELVKPFPALERVQRAVKKQEEQKKRIGKGETDVEMTGDGKKTKRKVGRGRSVGGDTPAVKAGIRRGKQEPARNFEHSSVGSASGKPPSPEQENGETSSEQQETELKFWMNDIRTQQREREELNERIQQLGLTKRWGEAMKAISPEIEKFARREFKYISGEIEDIWKQYIDWGTQLQRERVSVDRLKHVEEFDEWLEKALDRLMEYAQRYQAVLQAGRNILKEYRDTRPAKEKGQRTRGLRRLRSREVATMENRTWGDLHPEVQAAVNAEMGSMRERILVYYDSASAKLSTQGIDPETQHQVIMQKLTPILAENVQPLLTAAGMKITQDEVEQVALYQTKRLLADKAPIMIQYGGD